MRRCCLILVLALVVGGQFGCMTPDDPTASRDPSEVERRFQTTGADKSDYNKVVIRMVESLLNSEVIAQHDKAPMVVLGNVFNKTPYNVRTELLLNKIEVEMLRPFPRIVRFSSSTSEMRKGGQSGNLYKMLAYNESGYVDPETRKQVGKVIAADYILYGFVENIETDAPGATQAYFSFIMKLTSVETGENIWAEEAEITKVIK